MARHTDRPTPIPFGLRRDEWLKQLLPNLRWEAGAGISNADLHHLRLCPFGGNHEFTSWLVLHSFDPVPQQVEEHLLNLNLVDLDLQSCRVHLHADRQTRIPDAYACEPNGLFNHLRKVLCLHLDITLLHEITYPLHYLSGAVRLVRYAFECGLNPLSVSGRDETTTGIDVVADRSEGLIDLVDKRGHHLAEFGQALHMSEFRL